MHRLPCHAARLTLCASLAALVPACGDDAVAPTPFVALDQPVLPATSQGVYSDQSCGATGCASSTQQSTAENFVLSRSATLTEITIWGGYFPNDDPPPVDAFTVVLHSDATGAPGAGVHTEAVPALRTAPGGSFGGVTLYQYVLEFQTPPQLAAGTYWAEIFNNSGASTSNFTWVRGTLDATAGVAGVNFSATAPGSVWNHPTSIDVAIRIDAR